MALTRSFLKGLDIPEEKIASIIEAHTETTDALKEQRDEYKKKAEEYETTKTELEAIKAKGDFEKKYNDEHAAFEKYKNEREASDTKSAKENAYKELLVAAGISEKRIPAIMKVTDLSEITLGSDGKITGAEKLTEGIKTEWADFVTTEVKKGAETKTPPGNDGNAAPDYEKMTMEEYIAARKKK